jgi:hypothetical protein
MYNINLLKTDPEPDTVSDVQIRFQTDSDLQHFYYATVQYTGPHVPIIMYVEFYGNFKYCTLYIYGI